MFFISSSLVLFPSLLSHLFLLSDSLFFRRQIDVASPLRTYKYLCHFTLTLIRSTLVSFPSLMNQLIYLFVRPDRSIVSLVPSTSTPCVSVGQTFSLYLFPLTPLAVSLLFFYLTELCYFFFLLFFPCSSRSSQSTIYFIHASSICSCVCE